MIGVFIGQLILIAFLVAFAEHLPSWLIMVTTTAAVLLPVVVYFTILAEPPVYRAWRAALRETWDFGRAGLAALWRCLSVSSLLRVRHYVSTLRLLPDTADAWVALFLFPFKVYVLMAMPFLWLARQALRLIQPQFAYLRFPEATYAVSQVYVLCLGILLVGALVQALFGHRGRSTQTVLVFLSGFMFFFVLRPWGTVVR